MKKTQKLQISQLDDKILQFTTFPERPGKGWINAIRTSLNISLHQLGAKMGMTRQSVMEMEYSERSEKISLHTLQKLASTLNMKLVYGFLPLDGSFEKMIEKQALLAARKIVSQTDTTMKLEDQQVSQQRLEKSIKELAEEIRNEMPKYLWD